MVTNLPLVICMHITCLYVYNNCNFYLFANSVGTNVSYINKRDVKPS